MSIKHPKPTIVAIVGPTASGKSALAVRIAKKINGEIISADSRQVYRGLNIGTGKITKKEMRGIKHYCLDIANPKKTFTADDFRKAADKAIAKIYSRGKIPILVGGTGFYIDTTIYRSIIPNVKPDWKLRAQLEKRSPKTLFAQLQMLDPRRAKTIDQKNPRRLIRAIELIKHTGKPIPPIKKMPCYSTKVIFLNPSPKELKKRIVQRTAKMLKEGLVAEVRNLRKKLSRGRLQELGFEYKYPLFYIEGKISKEKMMEHINIETWHYAKRQMTWFKKYLQPQGTRSHQVARPLNCQFIRDS